MAAAGRLFSSSYALRDAAARRPVSGFRIEVRHVAERRWISPRGGNMAQQRQMISRHCGRKNDIEKASGESPALANIAVLLWYPSLGVLPLAYFSTTFAAIFTLSPASVLNRISTAPSEAVYFA